MIDESNKLIAEFMGGKWHNNFGCYLFEMPPTKHASNGWTELLYHESFDWLMPVIGKIFSLGGEKGVLKGYCKVMDSLCARDIKLLHTAVVEFIQWYNYEKGNI